MLESFLEATFIGMCIGAVVGPISLCFIQRTLKDGIKSSIAIGLGASLADGLYCVIAALGISGVSHFLAEYSKIIQVLGGIFLAYLGYHEFRKTDEPTAVEVAHKNSYFKLMIQIFFLTLMNPLTIASFVGVFASMGGADITVLESIVMSAGILVGSIIWWVILGAILLKTRHKFSDRVMHLIRTVSSFMIGGFGIFSIASGLL